MNWPCEGDEPGLEEGAQRRPFAFHALARRVLDFEARRSARIAEDEDIGQIRAGLALVNRGQEFVGGSARIGPAVREALAEVGRQFRPESPFQDADDDVAVGGRRDLRLERRVGPIELRLPPDRLEPGEAEELSVQPADNVLATSTLDVHVARRGNEQSENAHRAQGRRDMPASLPRDAGSLRIPPRTLARGAHAAVSRRLGSRSGRVRG